MTAQEQIEQQAEDVFRPAGNIIAENVSLETYMKRYAAHFCEYVEGYVIKISFSSLPYINRLGFLYVLLRAYFSFRPIGQVMTQPFVMRLPEFPNRRREPDLFIVLNTNPHELTDTYIDGPADIVIEIISPESLARDRGEKFEEYEKGGVPEYWLFDPERKDAGFYRLNANGKYELQDIGDDMYITPLLPDFQLQVSTLWQAELPGVVDVVKAVADMLGESL